MRQLCLLFLVALAACRGGDAPGSAAAEAEQDRQRRDTVADEASALARYDGYGPLRFGMTAAETLAAWQGAPLQGGDAADGGCHWMVPAGTSRPGAFALMVDGDKLSSFSTDSEAHVAPGGGRVGMPVEDIRRMYGATLREKPSQPAGARLLRIGDPNGSGGVLVFEIDAAGKVTQWRTGLPPQVDDVEGCG